MEAAWAIHFQIEGSRWMKALEKLCHCAILTHNREFVIPDIYHNVSAIAISMPNWNLKFWSTDYNLEALNHYHEENIWWCITLYNNNRAIAIEHKSIIISG